VWLLLLFVAEAYTSSVIQHFEEALESAIALAFFIPLLIGTGGNSGRRSPPRWSVPWRSAKYACAIWGG
jgi:Mg/Co/Ni transporter MgtE